MLEGVGIFNFLAWSVVGMFIGGTALFGHSGDGLYFVRDHGRLTEVSQWVYVYSWLHSLSQLVTFPMFAFGVVRRAVRRFQT